MNYEMQRSWSDKFLPHIKNIVGPKLLCEAPLIEDWRHNTDLCVLQMRDLRIACRVRKSSYRIKWPYDITLRMTVKSGQPTEFHKVMDGFGDQMFYGFAADDDGDQVGSWVLGDLDALRSWVTDQWVIYGRDHIPGQLFNNGDGTSGLGIDYRDIPDFVVDTSHPIVYSAASRLL
jgi:hypothetical protein